MANLFRWREGVRLTNYHTLRLVHLVWPVFADVTLIRYEPGSHIRPHRDTLRGRTRGWRHYRCVFVLKSAPRGGDFVMHEGTPIFRLGKRLFLFRSDRFLHEVTPVEGGRRYSLSLGLALPPRPADLAVSTTPS